MGVTVSDYQLVLIVSTVCSVWVLLTIFGWAVSWLGNEISQFVWWLQEHHERYHGRLMADLSE